MQFDWRRRIGEQDVCNAVAPIEVVVQRFHETAVLGDQSNQELILELVLYRQPLPIHGHQAQLLDGRNA